jgi:omega-amidase
MKVALVSLNQMWEDKKTNLLSCEKYIRDAELKEVDLIIFPEMTLTGFSTNISNISENEQDSETINVFKEFARQCSIAIIFGVVIGNDTKSLNKSIFIDNKGKVLGGYVKIHPFSFSGEDEYFNSGCELTIIQYKDFNIGLSICYDLRFPELYSALARKSDIIINIANWPKKRVNHWNTLLKARAIENQLYVCGVNRVGVDGNNLEYEESSQCINSNGEVLACEKIEGMKIYNIDKKLTHEFRENFNTVSDRVIALYKEII